MVIHYVKKLDSYKSNHILCYNFYREKIDGGNYHMKKVLKFKYDEKEGFLSVVEKEGFYYALVQKDTKKVEEIKTSNHMLISYDIKDPNYQNIFVDVVEDQKLIKEVFEQLKIENNLYFKDLNEDLVLFKIRKNQ